MRDDPRASLAHGLSEAGPTRAAQLRGGHAVTAVSPASIGPPYADSVKAQDAGSLAENGEAEHALRRDAGLWGERWERRTPQEAGLASILCRLIRQRVSEDLLHLRHLILVFPPQESTSSVSPNSRSPHAGQ
jgi:hypothetical protein